MSAGHVPTSPISDLYSNTTSETPASPTIMDAAIGAIVETIDDNYDALSSAVSGLISGQGYVDMGIINVKAAPYNAVGDGVTDDTSAINSAILAANGAGGGIVYVPRGTYMIDAITSIQMKSKVTLLLDPGATLKAIANSADQYKIVVIKDASYVRISGGTIQGERANHIGSSGEEGYGISVIGDSHYLLFDNITVKDCWGDGINLNTNTTNFEPSFAVSPSNITLDNVTCDNNRRNGFVMQSGIYVKVLNCVFKNTVGTSPQAGVDIEADLFQHVHDVTPKHITFENCRAQNNTGDGFAFTHEVSALTMRSCVSRDNGNDGISFVAGLMDATTYYVHNVVLDDVRSVSNGRRGVYGNYVNNLTVVNSIIQGNSDRGFLLTNTSDFTLQLSYLVDNVNKGLECGTTCTAINIIQSLFRNNGGTGTSTAEILYTSSGSAGVIGGKILDNRIESAAERGIWLGNANIKKIEIRGNNFDNFTGKYKVVNNSAVDCQIDLGFADSPPTTGYNGIGAIVRNANPAIGEYAGWVSVSAIEPSNAWVGYGQIGAKRDTTANRPTQVYPGYVYLDTTLDADGKTIWCNKGIVHEVDRITITAAATSSGNVTVTLNGVVTNVAVLAGDSTLTIATKIAAAITSDWANIVNNSGSFVTFYSNSGGPKSAPSYSAGTTGATGSATVVTAGANPTFVDATGAVV